MGKMEAFDKLCEVLKSRGNVEAARTLKQSSEEWLGMHNLLKKKDASIKDVLKKWKSLENAASRSMECLASLLASEKSESDSSNSSKSSKKTAPSSSTTSSSSDSSEDESSSGSGSSSSEPESEMDTAKEGPVMRLELRNSLKEVPKSRIESHTFKQNLGNRKASDADSSSNSSDSTSSSSDSSSSSSSSDGDSDSDSDSSSSDSETKLEEDAPPTKRRKIEEDRSSVKLQDNVTPEAKLEDKHGNEKPVNNGLSGTDTPEDSRKESPSATSGSNSIKSEQKGRQPRKSNTPFQRIKIDAVKFTDERLKDNSFHSRGAKAGDYGERAHADLIVTRGESFRKEKNKKKRGSYRGGEITLQSHSIKFT